MELKIYYRRINTAFLYAKEFNNLLAKSELGGEVSEYATVNSASSLSRYMAEELGLNAKKAEVLTKCKGMMFPPYGKEGMKYIRELAELERIEINEGKICKSIVLRILNENKFTMEEDFEKSIEDLFDRDPDKYSESTVVNTVFELLDDIFVLEKNDPEMKTKLKGKTFDFIVDSINESKRIGKITSSPKLEQLKRMAVIKEDNTENTEEFKIVLDGLWKDYKSKGFEGEELISSMITAQEPVFFLESGIKIENV